ncbi:hypothetical protein [Paenibacillus gansuensis]|uniref:DUF1828 domain-containing protein n=1 Tax=Paenibacillus gansuensis TaxID=306542 RepID=A0ABW5PGA4_9BACL
MRITASEFDRVSFKMLLNIQRGNYYANKFDFEISDETYFDVLKELLDDYHVEGFALVKMPGGGGFKAINPRVTRSGLSLIEKYIRDKVLLVLATKASSQGISDATMNKSELEKRLDVKSEQIMLHLESLENEEFIEITSKIYADDELYNYDIALTPNGFNLFYDTPHFKKKESSVVINGVMNNYSNSQVFNGDITFSDSFNHVVNSTALSREQKEELSDLIRSILTEKKVTPDNESKLKKYFGKLGDKAGEAVIVQSVTALIKSMLESNVS